jgi:hypothetical protein
MGRRVAGEDAGHFATRQLVMHGQVAQPLSGQCHRSLVLPEMDKHVQRRVVGQVRPLGLEPPPVGRPGAQSAIDRALNLEVAPIAPAQERLRLVDPASAFHRGHRAARAAAVRAWLGTGS